MKQKVIFQYTIFGALFGLIFPIVATIIRIYTMGLPYKWTSIGTAQGAEPLLWIIDCAPPILGAFAALGGFRQARVLELHQEQNEKIKALTALTLELQELRADLNQRIQVRTRALESIVSISHNLTKIMDLPTLANEVVEQVQKTYGYYHTQIYLLDEKKALLILVGGTGEAGRILLERGHNIPKGQGLVGRAAESIQPVVVADVSIDANWLPNPLLPETRSEVAVPVALGDKVMGVLDVQHNTPDAFQVVDIQLLESLASQVAIAMRNAQVYESSQRQVQREAMAASIGQQIFATTSVEDALKVAVRELGRATGAPEAVVRINTRSGNGNGGAQ